MRSCFCLSCLSQCGPFTFCCDEDVQLASGLFSEGNVLPVAVDLACLWEEVIAGFSHVAILDCTHLCVF